MEQRHERRNPLRKQIIHKFLIECNTGGVDGVITSADGNDAAPGDGEAVGFCTGKLEECDVFRGAVIGVAGYVAGTTVGDFTRDFAECVPDGGTTSVGFGGAFDLVARRLSTNARLECSKTTYLAVAKPQRKSLVRTGLVIVSTVLCFLVPAKCQWGSQWCWEERRRENAGYK